MVTKIFHYTLTYREESTDCSSSVRFLMLDLNVGLETVEERLLAVHFTSN